MIRLKSWSFQMLLALDQLAYVWLAGWVYVWLGRGVCPSADETISSCVGRQAIAGKRWALLAETIIDRLFLVLARQSGHCRASIEWDEVAAPLGRPRATSHDSAVTE